MNINDDLWGPLGDSRPRNTGPAYHMVQLHDERGVWWLDYNDSSGKWTRKSLNTRDKAEALKRRKIFIENVEAQLNK